MQDYRNSEYEIIRKTLYDSNFNQRLTKNPEEVFQEHGITNPQTIQELKQILTFLFAGAQSSGDMQQFVLTQLKSTSETADAFKVGLRSTLKQIDKGYRSTMLMYTIAFYLGVVLVLVSAYIALTKGISLLSVIFGGLGILDFLGFFFTKPAQNLQSSRSDLAQLQAAYYNWFNDCYNWNSYLGELHNTKNLDFSKIKEISELLFSSTDRTMSMIEKYCESDKK